jgi:Major Facilitator Superfamily
MCSPEDMNPSSRVANMVPEKHSEEQPPHNKRKSFTVAFANYIKTLRLPSYGPLVHNSTRAHSSTRVRSLIESTFPPNPRDNGREGTLKGPLLSWCIIHLSFASFSVGLDQRMILTITPKVTDAFHSLAEMGWYGSAYFLALAVGHLVWRKFYFFFPSRPPLTAAALIFAVGGALCTISNSPANVTSTASFVTGRAITGFGAAGILRGILVIATDALPIKVHYLTLNLAHAAFCLGFLGSLVGGLCADQADRISWKLWLYIVSSPGLGDIFAD